jgi:hypothetical protein
VAALSKVEGTARPVGCWHLPLLRSFHPPLPSSWPIKKTASVINFRPPSITTSSFPLLLPSSPSLSSHHNQSTSSWFVGTFTIFLYHIERYFASTPSLQLLSDSDLFRFIATKPEPERCKIMSSPGHPQRSPDKIAPIFTAIIQGETPSGPLLASVSVSIL